MERYWNELKAHPAADNFPLMVSSDLESLAHDIKKSGQLFPIMLTNEETPRILDGRNRLRAFAFLANERKEKEKSGEQVGPQLEPWIETYKGELKPFDYVRAVNWERMHLNPSQRARLAVLMMPKAQEEARVRMESGRAADDPCKAAEVAGKLYNVSPRQVEKAARIQKEDPKAFEKLGEKNGSTVNSAYAKLPKKTKCEQRKQANSELMDALRDFFTALSTAQTKLRALKLEVRDVPSSLDSLERGRYLSYVINFEKELGLVMVKLQGR